MAAGVEVTTELWCHTPVDMGSRLHCQAEALQSCGGHQQAETTTELWWPPVTSSDQLPPLVQLLALLLALHLTLPLPQPPKVTEKQQKKGGCELENRSSFFLGFVFGVFILNEAD